MGNIVISGYYGSRNGGDEAMLAAMIEVLSDLDPKLNITVISANPEVTELKSTRCLARVLRSSRQTRKTRGGATEWRPSRGWACRGFSAP